MSIPVKIIGDHPWSGHTGTLIAVQKPSIGILPVMGRVRLDQGDGVPYEHECFAESKNLVQLVSESPRERHRRKLRAKRAQRKSVSTT